MEKNQKSKNFWDSAIVFVAFIAILFAIMLAN